MGFLDDPRSEAIRKLRDTVVKRLMFESDRETNPTRQQYIEAMARSVAFTPVEVFSGRKVLQEGVEKKGDLYSFFQVKGQTLIGFMEKIVSGGGKDHKEILISNKIQIGELWEGKRFNPNALMTLFHEFGHNAKLHANLPALNERQEEQLADTLAIFTAEKLGFPTDVMRDAIKGREAIIGKPYSEFLSREVEVLKRRRQMEAQRIERLRPKKGRSRIVPFALPQRRPVNITNRVGRKWTTMTSPKLQPSRIGFQQGLSFGRKRRLRPAA